jgi:PAS domain S-box-containing protein
VSAMDAERDRLRQELALRNSALDAMTSHLIITDARDPSSAIVYVNRAVLISSGYEREELMGQSPDFLTPHALNPEATLAVQQAVRRGESLRTELRSRRKDGSTYWAGVTLTPVRNTSGAVTHYVAIGADITATLEEREARERLQEQLYAEGVRARDLGGPRRGAPGHPGRGIQERSRARGAARNPSG